MPPSTRDTAEDDALGIIRMGSRTVPEDLDRLNRTWAPPPGFLHWFTHVNQRRIGLRFIVTSLVFFVLAGGLALLMRLQLAVPENSLVSPDLFNQFFTMHGTTMMFLFAIPMVEGLGIYLAPLMIGTRDMAFPRLNAFGYYIYLIGGSVLFISLLLGMAPATGWFSYVPLAGKEYSPGLGPGFWSTMITFIEVSALTAAVELVVTILKQRAPGMSLNRMPLFVWSILVMALMIIFAMPAVIVSSVMLALDRTLSTQFFVTAAGGEPLLWQHLFWFFGHPEVYIIVVPALGVISTIIATFTQRPIYGYIALVQALVAIGFVSFGLWVHHMFTVGLPQLGLSFFTAASAMIAIPSTVQVYCWIASLWGVRVRFATPMLYILGFFAIFVLGGLTGVMVASIPFDMQVHDTYFVVAHLHYVLIGGMVFPVFAGLYYWYPKVMGRMMSERLGRWSFGLAFVGFNMTFLPMHQLGLEGMPRRVYTYLDAMGWGNVNLFVTVGAFVLASGFLLTFWNFFYSLRRGAPAGNNPWNAATLEWATTSPPQNCNFPAIPVVQGRYANWDETRSGERHCVAGLSETQREVVVTTIMDAQPQAVQVLPKPTFWPFLAAVMVAFGFLGFMFYPILFVVAFFLTFFMIVGWLWPRRPWQEEA